MGEGYRIDRQGKPHVQHIDEDGAWCGPVIGKAGHSREGEIPGKVLCIACGDFCPGIPERFVEAALRSDRAWERQQAAEEESARRLRRLAAAGVDVSKLTPPAPKAPRKRGRQLAMFGGGSGR